MVAPVKICFSLLAVLVLVWVGWVGIDRVMRPERCSDDATLLGLATTAQLLAEKGEDDAREVAAAAWYVFSPPASEFSGSTLQT